MDRTPEGSINRIRPTGLCCWAAAILFFLGLSAAGICLAENKKDSSPEVVIFGDSIFAPVEDWRTVGERLQERSGLTVLSGAFGGTCLARQNVRDAMDFDRDWLSLAVLARSAASEDFAVQQSVRSAEPATWYFEETVDELDRVDFDDVKVLILAFGINDYHSAVPVEDPEAPMEETTYAGALRTVIELLRERYPDLRLLLVTPTYSWYPDRGMTCEEFDPGAGFLRDYVEKELEIARECGVEILDLYHDFYPHENLGDWTVYTRDGVHPNEAGMEKIAAAIADHLEENP